MMGLAMNSLDNALNTPIPAVLDKFQHDLDCALDTKELIDILFDYLNQQLGISGINYDNPELHIHIKLGNHAAHSCEYTLSQDGRQLGTISTTQAHRLSEVALTRLETILGMFVMPLQDSLMYQQAMTFSQWDPVTRVNNKTAFTRALNTFRHQRRQRDKKLNAIFLQLSDLGSIYARHGSDVADAMLCHFIDLLREQCRNDDQIFRFSDDEFVVLLADTTAEQANVIAERLKHICQQHHEHARGLDISCQIAVEMVACDRHGNCDGCQQANRHRCLQRETRNALHGAA